MAEDNELQELREKLAIADEILQSKTFWRLHDFDVHFEDGLWRAGTKHSPYRFAMHTCLYGCIRQARQKLAAERAEAAKSERERKLDQCLRQVAAEIDGMSLLNTTPIFKIRDMIRQALES